ncbi:major facilitator superfamily domain-containing protein 6-like [Neopsephotus bourkii]|uniref:major facilitator superfamily domain-containing protein 6-like n=1 Tax=Neopsephotus bourkii TaxID=309878 RepID=UPI002AA579E1|nr:major facilitator superfamily domain-containing protein 6-like [Neopsephotus bourkii]
MSKQWFVGRVLALSCLFRALQGAGRGCASPFLTLYLRHLGLPAALVGLVAGAQRLAAALCTLLCACCPCAAGRRRLLVAGAALGSVGAVLLLTLVPPAAAGALCNDTRQAGHRAAGPRPDTGSYGVQSASAAPTARAVSKGATQTTAGGLTASGRAAVSSPASQRPSGPTDVLEKQGRGDGEGGTETNGYLGGASGWTPPVKAVNWETHEPEMPDSSGPPLRGLERETSILGSAARSPAGNAEERRSTTKSNQLPVFKTTFPAAGDAYVSGNLSDHQKDSQGTSFEAVLNIFQDRKHQVFLMVLVAVVLWELLATSLERTVDESLYEFFDFVDATEGYGKLWIWSYLGASVGACSIAVVVDHLNCFLSSSVIRLAVHFYGYALLVTLSLLVTVFFPIHLPKESLGINRMGNALALLWGDGQAMLYASTLLVTGVAAAAVHDFLFCQLEDRGSSELYMGLSVAVGLLAEMLLYFFKGKLLRTFSRSTIVAISLSLLAVQLLCYSFLWTVWSVLLIKILSAFSSGALWWVVSMTVNDIATLGTARSLHTALQGLCHGGGASLGSFAGGFVVEHFGSAVLYRACCVCLVLWLFLFLIVQSKLPQQKKINYSRLLADGSSDGDDSDEENERDWLVKAMKDESFGGNWSHQCVINFNAGVVG